MDARTRRTLIATALALGLAAGPAAAAQPRSPAAQSAHQQRPVPAGDAADLAAALAGLPGADTTAALVRVGGTRGTWRGSAGVHDLASGRPADPDARFRIGSVTKVFTAATVLRLAARGRIDLDRTARSYLPDLVPAAYAGVTVRQLLNHTHGIPAARSSTSTVEEAYADRFTVHDPRETARSALSLPREFAPGTAQHYLNIGYTLAGLIVERVTGDAFAHQVEREVLRPLGLRDTYSPGTSPYLTGPYNHGYQVMDRGDGTRGPRDVSAWTVTDAWAAGDLVSTTADLERFTRALFAGKLLEGPLLEEMFTLPRDASGALLHDHEKPSLTAAYAVGLSVTRLGGHEVWGKTGGRWGYNTAVAATRDGGRTLVYSVNATDAKGQDMNATALGIVTAAYGRPDAPRGR
ncbi:serine hydrolase domain-containing protein [Streptomyces sp. NPDC001941]|uniref:serine hydrolase domain-containing protein n=1 Tax=Streptomyces sp. NPDC001941 TaxID=3154659 RepID=UPI0033205397